MAVRYGPFEFTQCGLSRLSHLAMLLTQHLFAAAAHVLLHRSPRHRSSRSRSSKVTKPEPPFRCSLDQHESRGLIGLMYVRLLLTQHFLEVAARFMLRCSPSRRSGHTMIPMSVDFRPTLRRIVHQLTEGGTKPPFDFFPLLTQHFLACAAVLI